MKSVLIIEDNNDIRENTAEILELAGYKPLQQKMEKRVLTLLHGKNPL